MNPEVPPAENQNAAPIQKRPRRRDPVEILAFLIPCLQFVQIKLIGVLNGSDIMFLAVFFYLCLRREIKIRTAIGKWLLVLCGLWLVSQCVTDVVRHSAMVDYARGWSAIGITFANFAVLLTLIYGRPRRLIFYGWGLAVGNILRYFITPSELATDYPWKFGISFSVNLAIFLLISRKQSRGHWPITISAILGLFNILMGTRSQGGACLAAALYLLVTRSLRKRRTKLEGKSLVALTASLILGAASIMWIYHYSASTGLLGQEAREKYEIESSGKYGVLLGGRTELLASIPAIYDSPILGHGSWAKDPIYLLEQRQALALMGYVDAGDIGLEDLEEGGIPAHSFIFGSWVDAGLLGAVFWVWIFVLLARAMMHIYPANFVLLPVVTLAAFSLFWDLLFSPYGGEMRTISPYFIVLVLSCSAMVLGKNSKAVPLTAKGPIATSGAPAHENC